MKSLFLKSLLGAVAVGASASALSLYDTAPNVGLPESQAARYFVSINSGYDTNPTGATKNQKKEASAYVGASVSSTFADVESVDRLTYALKLGGTRYLGGKGVGGQRYYGDSNADVTMSHAFSSMSRYTCTLHLSYKPEPGYDNGVSSAGMHGDTLSWGLNNSYSQAIDDRWSWHMGANLSGTKYHNSAEAQDDRQYYSVSCGMNYRESDLLTYTSSLSYRWEERTQGASSRSIFASLGVQYALDPVSSASLSAGVQGKTMANEATINPTLDLGYRRRVADGLSLNSYVKYSDENVDNYNRGRNASFRTGGTWRVGVYGTYVLSPDVSYVFNLQVMQTNYRRPTNADMSATRRYSVRPSVTMNYNFTPNIMGNLSAEYSYYASSRDVLADDCTRWKFTAGLSYRF